MDKKKEKKLEILFFLIILLWQIIFNFILFPQRLFLKYPLNALKFFSKLEPSERFLDFSPLYLFINGFFEFFSKDGYKLIPYLQIVFCLIAFYIFFLWVKENFSIFLAYIITFLGSIYPSYLLYLNCLEPEAFLIFSIIGGLVFILKEKSSLLTGTFFTISFLLRPSFLPITLFVLLFIKRKKGLYLIPVFGGILLLLFFSYWATGFFTLTFMSPGTVFYEGNNPQATGVAAIYPKTIKLWEQEFAGKEADYAHKLYRKVSNFESGKENSLIENQFFWFKKVFNFSMDYPFKSFFHFLNKFWYYLSSGEAHDIFSLILINNSLGIFKIFSFSIFSSLAFLGLFFNFKKIPKLLVYLFILNIILLSIFYFSSRQRMTLFSFIIFLSVYGIDLLRKRKVYIIIFLLFLVIFSIKPKKIGSFESTFIETQNAGNLRELSSNFSEEKKIKEASQFLSLSIGTAPYLSYIHSRPFLPFYGGTPYRQALSILKQNDDFNKGLLYFYDGNTKEALRYFEKIKFKKIEKHYYNQDLPGYYYIICLLRENKIEEGKKYLEILKNKYPAYISLLSLDYFLNGRNNLNRYYDILFVNFKLAETSFFLKDFENALKYSKEVIKIAPEILYAHEISSISNAYLGNFKEMAEDLNYIISRKNLIVFHREWQDITEKLEGKFGNDKNYTEFLNYLRTLFPKPVQ